MPLEDCRRSDMTFYYIRHGDPIYKPDSLTEKGIIQAEALGKVMANVGLDKIYCSTSNRAMMTAEPTLKRLGMEMELLDFANESYAYHEFNMPVDGKKRWLYQNDYARSLFCTPEIKELGFKWYDHPELKEYNYEKAMERVYNSCDELFASLGYEHERYSGRYKVTAHNDMKVALFAHEGFGKAFFSSVFDIPYPIFCNHFHLFHTGVSVIQFKNEGGYAIPEMKRFSSTSHLFVDGLSEL